MDTVTEDQLKRALIKRGFFEAAQKSLKQWLDRLIKEKPEQVFYRGKMRAYYKGRAALIEENPSYQKICGELLPTILYNAERWQQITDPDVVAERPYLRYVCMCREDDWPSHAEKYGIVLPVNHSFWFTWAPPNSFGCLCSLASISERELSRHLQDPKYKIGVDISTFRYPMPDSGFDFNPGLLNCE